MSIRNLLNTEGQNRGLLSGTALAIDVAGTITKSYTVNGSILLTGTGGAGASSIDQVLQVGDDCMGNDILNAGTITTSRINSTDIKMNGQGGDKFVVTQNAPDADFVSRQLSTVDLSDGVTGTGNIVLSTNAVLITPDLGIPSAADLSNCTNFNPSNLSALVPLNKGGVHADLSATGGPSQVLLQESAGADITVRQLDASDLTNGVNGTGAIVLESNPILTAPNLGIPSAGNLINCSGYPTSSLSGIVDLAHGGTNSNLSVTGGTSQVLRQSSTGANITVSQLAASDLSNGTSGSGAVVLATSGALTTPNIGTPSAGTLTNCTGYNPANLSAAVSVAKGGTGLTTVATNGLLKGNGTSAMNVISPGTNGQVLTMVSGAPAWSTAGGGSGTVTSVQLTSPNSNAILSGTNPITTSGTININVGTKVDYNPTNVNMNLGDGPMNTAAAGSYGNMVITNLGENNLTTAQNNTIIGMDAAPNISTGSNNTIIGNSGFFLSSVQGTTIIGSAALVGCDDNNSGGVYIGSGVLGSIASGNLCSNNVFIGKNAGQNAAITPGNTVAGVVAIGNDVANSNVNYNGSVMIGYGANNIDNLFDTVTLGVQTLNEYMQNCQIGRHSFGLTQYGMGLMMGSFAPIIPLFDQLEPTTIEHGVRFFTSTQGNAGFASANVRSRGTICTRREGVTYGTTFIPVGTSTVSVASPAIFGDEVIMLTKYDNNAGNFGINVFVQSIAPGTFTISSNINAAANLEVFWTIVGSPSQDIQ